MQNFGSEIWNDDFSAKYFLAEKFLMECFSFLFLLQKEKRQLHSYESHESIKAEICILMKLIQTFLLQREPPGAGARTGDADADADAGADVDVVEEDVGDDDDDTGDDEGGQHWWVGASGWGRTLSCCSP